MNPALGLLAVVSAAALGCGKSSDRGTGSSAGNKAAEVRRRPGPADGPKARAADPGARPAPRARKPADAPVAGMGGRVGARVPARKMPKEAFKATVKRPTYPVLYRLCREPNLRDLTGWGLEHSVGGTRFLAVVRGTQRKGDGYEFKLALIDKQSGDWKLVWKLGLRTTEPSFYAANDVGAASLFVDDYDWDGKPEALVRYRYSNKPERAVGWTELTDLMIVNVDGLRPTVAFFASFHRDPQAETPPKVRSQLAHRDLNGDGHPDLVITRRTSTLVPRGEDWVKKRTVDTEMYLWDPATDAYKPVPKKARTSPGSARAR